MPRFIQKNIRVPDKITFQTECTFIACEHTEKSVNQLTPSLDLPTGDIFVDEGHESDTLTGVMNVMALGLIRNKRGAHKSALRLVALYFTCILAPRWEIALQTQQFFPTSHVVQSGGRGVFGCAERAD